MIYLDVAAGQKNYLIANTPCCLLHTWDIAYVVPHSNHVLKTIALESCTGCLTDVCEEVLPIIYVVLMCRIAAPGGPAYHGKHLLYLLFGCCLILKVWYGIEGFPIPIHRFVPTSCIRLLYICLRSGRFSMGYTCSDRFRTVTAILMVGI